MRIACETAAVLVTLRDSDRLRSTIASVRRDLGRSDATVICVLNDPARTETTREDGVWYVGAGINLGWAAGMHAGLVGVESEYVWAVQDDLVVTPGAHRELKARLEQTPSWAAARPLPVDRDGLVPVGFVSSTVDGEGEFSRPIPPVAIPADEIGEPVTGSFLPSSGQFIRRAAWDATGGFDPWFYPWGYVDVDFGRTLREAGWSFGTVPAARMQHDMGGSTTAPFRVLAAARNRSLFAAKWADGGEPAASEDVDPVIVKTVREGRGRPRHHDLAVLRDIVGAAASDTLRYCARALPQLVAAEQRPLEQQIIAAYVARDAAVAARDAALSDRAFAEEQFRTAAAQRDAAIEQRDEIFNSRAWQSVAAYWRLRRRILGR